MLYEYDLSKLNPLSIPLRLDWFELSRIMGIPWHYKQVTNHRTAAYEQHRKKELRRDLHAVIEHNPLVALTFLTEDDLFNEILTNDHYEPELKANVRKMKKIPQYLRLPESENHSMKLDNIIERGKDTSKPRNFKKKYIGNPRDFEKGDLTPWDQLAYANLTEAIGIHATGYLAGKTHPWWTYERERREKLIPSEEPLITPPKGQSLAEANPDRFAIIEAIHKYRPRLILPRMAAPSDPEANPKGHTSLDWLGYPKVSSIEAAVTSDDEVFNPTLRDWNADAIAFTKLLKKIHKAWGISVKKDRLTVRQTPSTKHIDSSRLPYMWEDLDIKQDSSTGTIPCFRKEILHILCTTNPRFIEAKRWLLHSVGYYIAMPLHRCYPKPSLEEYLAHPMEIEETTRDGMWLTRLETNGAPWRTRLDTTARDSQQLWGVDHKQVEYVYVDSNGPEVCKNEALWHRNVFEGNTPAGTIHDLERLAEYLGMYDPYWVFEGESRSMPEPYRSEFELLESLAYSAPHPLRRRRYNIITRTKTGWNQSFDIEKAPTGTITGGLYPYIRRETPPIDVTDYEPYSIGVRDIDELSLGIATP